MNKNQSFYHKCLVNGEPCRLLASWIPTPAELRHSEETYQILAEEYLLWEYTSDRKTFIEGKFNGEWATSPGRDSALFAKHLLNFGSEQNGSLSTRSLLAQILQLRSYRDDWDSYGARAVSESAVLDAVSWLTTNTHPITNAPHISPSPGQDRPSGVAMEWSSESGELEIDFFGGGKMGFLIVTPGGEEEGEIPIKDWPHFFKSRLLERILAPGTLLNPDGCGENSAVTEATAEQELLIAVAEAAQIPLTTNLTRQERIKCPECGMVQIAMVEAGVPFDIYIHYCSGCQYIIMESEWETV